MVRKQGQKKKRDGWYTADEEHNEQNCPRAEWAPALGKGSRNKQIVFIL